MSEELVNIEVDGVAIKARKNELIMRVTDREGTGWLYRTLKRILAGEATDKDLGLLLDVANRIEGHTICGLGDAAAWPVQSFLKHFRPEFEYMVEHGGRSIVDAQRVSA